MKRLYWFVLLVVALFSSCGHKKGSEGQYPENFNKIGDIRRIDYMMRNVAPDSLARFIIDASLGRIPEAPIDTLALATVYVYDNLKGSDLDLFCTQYDSYVESLPLDDKMKIYVLAGTDDPQRLGYKLGLEYLGSIRENNKTAAQIEDELKAFRKACGTDTVTYHRFIIGFHTVLAVDSGKDLSPEIYNKFINFE